MEEFFKERIQKKITQLIVLGPVRKMYAQYHVNILHKCL